MKLRALKFVTLFAVFLFLYSFKMMIVEKKIHFERNENKRAKFDFTKPTKILKLDSKLAEISGLGFDLKNNALFTLNDEKGIIYEIDKEDGAIQSKKKFGKEDDYEGIEIVNQHIITVNSAGNLFFYNTKSEKTKKVKTDLRSKNNIEGLAYHQKQQKLLLACKGYAFKNTNADVKTVCSFDLKKMSFDKNAYLEIDRNKLVNFADDRQASDELLDRIRKFSPSGITIYHATQDIYICSARGSSIVVYNELKQIKNIIFLDELTIPQPEGITFDNENNLYISSEGKKKGKIFVYAPIVETPTTTKDALLLAKELLEIINDTTTVQEHKDSEPTEQATPINTDEE